MPRFRRRFYLVSLLFLAAFIIGLIRLYRIPACFYGSEKPGEKTAAGLLKLETIEKECKSLNETGFVFLACGDPGDGYGTFEKIRKRMITDSEAGFVAVLGDLVKYGTRIRHQVLKRELAGFSLPVIPVPGDHDYDTRGSLAGFRGIWGNWDFQPIRFMDAAFVIAHSSGPERMTEEILDKLDAQLKSLQSVDMKIVMVHEPPFDPRFEPGGKNADNFYHFGCERSRKFHEMMIKHGVKAVLSGHLHGYFYLERDGVQYIISGGAGSKFLDYNPKGTNFFHYLRVTVGPESVSHEVVRVDAPLREGWHFEGIRYLVRLNLYLLTSYPDFFLGAIGLIVIIVAATSYKVFHLLRPAAGKITGIISSIISAVISAMILLALYLILLARL